MKQCIYAISLFLLSYTTYAQTLDSIANDRLVTQYESLTTQQFKENIYIHTDKDIYEPGEDLWFKAYILNGNNLKLSRSTAIVFVELIKIENDDRISIVKEKYEAYNGFANGHLFLAEVLEDGKYQLVIHTKNTLESRAENIRAVKEFDIKTSIIPQILIDTEFSKKVYDQNDKVSLSISVFSRSRTPFVNTNIIADLYAGSKKIDRIRTKTNTTGEATISFPVEKTKKATTIQLRVKEHKKKVNYTIDIPFKKPAAIQFGLYPEGGNLVENLPNTVAFKAVDHHGKPLPVKGYVLEDGKKIRSFEASHYGMGKFLFKPKSGHAYTVKLTNPKLDSVFQLPEILPKGIKLQVDRSNKRYVHFSISKTKDVSTKKVYIRAQSRGIVHWMAIGSLTKNTIRFKLPLEKLPQGISEITLFNENYEPIAERLIYANLDQRLHITLDKKPKDFYAPKDKVELKFKVLDQYKKPIIANLSLSVYDHLYDNQENDYSLMSHYYLFSELKGHVYDASYYFDTKNKHRAQHLDLLLLTQGWRTYTWNAINLNPSKSNPIFSTSIDGKVFKVTKDGTLQNGVNAEIRVVLPESFEAVNADATGNFSFSTAILKIAQGFQLTFFPEKTEEMLLELQDYFENIHKITKNKQFTFPETDIIKAAKKQSSYDTKFSFTETNYLEEVNLTAYKDRKKNKGNGYKYEGSDSDYICFQFSILNCKNHSPGSKPVPGKTYLLNDGSSVLYTGPSKNEDKNRNFVMIKGFYPSKEYYSPVYDTKEDKLFPDNRKTLFWAPNLISNEKGEIIVSFYTSDVQTTFMGKLEGTNGNGLLGSNSFLFNRNK